jgi:uncharacterized membrane protein
MVSRKRHLAKAISYRLFGSITTALMVWAISGDLRVGLIFGPADFIIKVLLYYCHERLWVKSRFGIRSTHDGD